MVHNAITKHIVTAGDYNLVARDQTLYNCVNCGKPDEKVTFNVAPGQLVAFTISQTTLQPVTVDETDIAGLNGQDLYIGVGVDTDGDGAADDVRLLAGEKIDRCLIDEVKVSAPVCGQPQILAAYLDCVDCWETYTVNFRYSDNRTRSWGLVRSDYEEITVSFDTECHSCTDCEPDANADEVICKLVDGLNAEFNTRIQLNGEDLPYPDKKVDFRPKPFRAVRLQPNWFTFCLNPIADACEGCNAVDAITSANINGQSVTFTGNLNPADNTQSFIAQLKNIAAQIECGFDEEIGKHSGFAFVTGGATGCCPIQLHVVTCDETFELIDVNGAIVPCDGVNPFPDFDVVNNCVNCGSSPSATEPAPSHGIAVILEQPSIGCDCFPTKPDAFLGRVGELTFIKEIDDYAPVLKAKELLSPALPENFGAWIQWLEYSQETGGRGRQYRDVNANQGWLRLPDSVSRARNAVSFADCSKSYCTYYLGHNMERKPSLTKSIAYNRLNSYIHIPSDDFNTLGDFEALLTAVVAESDTNCKVLSVLNCVQIPGSPSYVPTYAPTYAPTYTPTYSPTPN